MRAPTDKLPLAVRKNVRDEFESKRAEYEANVHKILGEAWTIEVNANLLYSYADDTYKNQLGYIIVSYMDAFISNLQRFADKFGEDGKTELNTACSKHQVSLTPQDTTTTFTYGGLSIQDGTLRIVFAEDRFASNVSDVSEDFAQALKDVPATTGSGASSALNIVARNGIKEDYDPEVEKVRKTIATLVNMPNLKLNPNFEQNAATLVKSGKAEHDWDRNLGRVTLDYFHSVESVLEREKFDGDEMLQEAFQESVEYGEICVRIVENFEDSRYNEVRIEEGVLYVQTVPKYWWTNVDDAALKLMHVL